MPTETLKNRITDHGRRLLKIFPNAKTKIPDDLCRRLRRIEAKGAAFALRLCNGPEYESPEYADTYGEKILAEANELLGNVRQYQPKTGEKCGCKKGQQRDNCPTCEGTGQVIDFRAIRTQREVVPIFLNRDPRGYALKIDDEYVRTHRLDIPTDWGGYGLIAPDLQEGN